ncbi:MAG: hypothetical protein JXB47_11930 [Anaerolineae bacterium]|nr:hypothetical protein [Anaerolineae bacterium]
MAERRRRNLFWPLLLLGIGGLTLLHALGAVPEYLWDLLARLWPLALVLFGLAAFIARRTALTNALMFVGVCGLAVGVFAAGYTRQALQPAGGNQQAIDIELKGASDISIRLDLNLTELTVGVQPPGEAPGRLTGTFTGSVENELTADYSLFGTQGAVTLTETTVNPIPKLEDFGGNRLELFLPPDIPLKLFIAEGEVGSMTIDLTGLDLQLSEALRVQTNLGDVSVTLPDGAQLIGDLAAAQGAVRLRYPFGMPMRLKIDAGLRNMRTIPEELEQLAAGPWETKGFLDEDFLVNLNLSTQFGEIIVEYTN